MCLLCIYRKIFGYLKRRFISLIMHMPSMDGSTLLPVISNVLEFVTFCVLPGRNAHMYFI